MIHAKFPMITVIMQTIFEAADFCLKKNCIILLGNPNLKNSRETFVSQIIIAKILCRVHSLYFFYNKTLLTLYYSKRKWQV